MPKNKIEKLKETEEGKKRLARANRIKRKGMKKGKQFTQHGEAAGTGLNKKAEVEYRGHTFPGYNKPMKSWRKGKKKVVLAKKGDQVKIVHFGATGYGHNYSAAARKSYLARSAGIKGVDDKFSANYWARKILWAGKGGSTKSSPKGVQGKYASAKVDFDSDTMKYLYKGKEYKWKEEKRKPSERVISGIIGGGVPSALLTGALNIGSIKKNPKGVLTSAATAGAFGSAIGTLFSSPKKKTLVPAND